MRWSLPWLTGIALALGFAHLGLSAMALEAWSADVLWFAGSGLAIVIAGLLNVVMFRATSMDRIQKVVWIAANLVTALFFGAAWTVLPQPQVIVGGLVFMLLAVCVAGQRSRAGLS